MGKLKTPPSINSAKGNFVKIEDKEFVVKGSNLDLERDPPLLK